MGDNQLLLRGALLRACILPGCKLALWKRGQSCGTGKRQGWCGRRARPPPTHAPAATTKAAAAKAATTKATATTTKAATAVAAARVVTGEKEE